jgi:hypothetical protein
MRTLFVAVTVAAVPLGWAAGSWRWIQQRHEFLAANRSDSAVIFMDEDRSFASRGFAEHVGANLSHLSLGPGTAGSLH